MSLDRINITTDKELFLRFKLKCKRNNASASAVLTQLMSVYLGETLYSGDIDIRIAALETRLSQLERKYDDDYGDGK